jgi:site-specific recombinase XerD
MNAARANPEGVALARRVHDFVWDYAPSHLTPSEHTLRSYRTALSLYVEWLASEGVTPSGLTASDFCAARMESWLKWLAEDRGNAPQTCNVRLAALRAFCRYVSRHDATFAHLEAEALAVRQRKAPKVKVGGMSEDAVSALAHAPDQATRCGRRDVALLVTLYATACRVGELLSMRVSQLHLLVESPHALVRGKGGKMRVVYVPERCVDHLLAYMDEFHGGSPDPDAYLFWSRNHPAGTHPLSRDAVANMLRKHAARARETCPEVPATVTPHTLRHARASHWLEHGMGIAQISLLLGHASVQTTMDYLDVTVDARAKAIQSVSDAPKPEKKWRGSETTLLSFCGLSG